MNSIIFGRLSPKPIPVEATILSGAYSSDLPYLIFIAYESL